MLCVAKISYFEIPDGQNDSKRIFKLFLKECNVATVLLEFTFTNYTVRKVLHYFPSVTIIPKILLWYTK